jgi:hypothetical protein
MSGIACTTAVTTLLGLCSARFVVLFLEGQSLVHAVTKQPLKQCCMSGAPDIF